MSKRTFLFLIFSFLSLFPLKTYADNYATNRCYNFLKILNNKNIKINKSFIIREAVNWGRIAVKKDNNNPDSHDCLGEAYLKEGRINSGVKQLDYSLFLLHERNKNGLKKMKIVLSKKLSNFLPFFSIIYFSIIFLSFLISIIYLFFLKKGRLKILKYINGYKKSIFGIEFKLLFLIILVSISLYSFVLFILAIIEIGFNGYQTGFNFLKMSFSGLVAIGTISMAYVTYINITKTSISLSALKLREQFESLQSLFFSYNNFNFLNSVHNAGGYFILVLDETAGFSLLSSAESNEIKNKGDFIIMITNYVKTSNNIKKVENFIQFYYSNKKDILLLLESVGDEEIFQIIPDLFKNILEFSKNFKEYLDLLNKYNISYEFNIMESIKEEKKLQKLIKELKEKSDNLYKLYKEIIEKIPIIVKKLEII